MRLLNIRVTTMIWIQFPLNCQAIIRFMIGSYRIITLCGSTRFKEQYIAAEKSLTLKRNIVISVGLFGHSGDPEVYRRGNKKMLDDMHLRKIDLADEIFVINPGGYVGESTRNEINYAVETGKTVRYLENSDVIDLQNNPFARNSWISQGYPFTHHRKEQFKALIGLRTEEIRSKFSFNEGSYPAFIAIRWGFARILNGRVKPAVKWSKREDYDGYGNRLRPA